MSHQYPTTPAYGAHYSPPNPYYPQFSQTGQQGGVGSPAYNQLNGQGPSVQTPTTPANISRFDMNPSVHHQPAPLPFAPHFNPEMLKHFPAPPHPPFPLGFPHFPPPVNTPPIPIQHANFPPFPPPLPTEPHHFTPHAAEPVSTQKPYALSIPGLYDGKLDGQIYDQPIDGLAVSAHEMGESTDRSMRGAGNVGDPRLERLLAHGKDVSAQRNSNASTVNSSQQTSIVRRVGDAGQVQQASQSPKDDAILRPTPNAQPELKERAKAAILSLFPYNIRYETLLTEGVNSNVLQGLYEELGLNWKGATAQTLDKSATADLILPRLEQDIEIRGSVEQKGGNQQKPSVDVSVGAAVNKISSVVTSASASKASPSINQNMERKDRIAQLLAAKAGKVSVPNAPSKSQSPASTTEPTPSQLPSPPTGSITQGARPTRTLAQTELVRQKMEQLKKETMAKSQSDQTKDFTAPFEPTGSDQLNSAPAPPFQITLTTPVREHLLQNGFASLIPGLFMTSAEVEEAELPSRPAEQYASDDKSTSSRESIIASDLMHGTQPPSVSPLAHASRKRPASENRWRDNEELPSKRQAVEASNSTSDAMDTDRDAVVIGDDDASEGEVIEDERGSHSDQQLDHNTFPEVTQPQQSVLQNHTRKRVELDIAHKPYEEIDQRQDVQQNQRYVPTPATVAAPTSIVAPTISSFFSSPVSKLLESVPGSIKPDDRQGQSPRSLLKVTPEQIAERAAQLKADLLRQRALRQKQLQDGIPVLDSEVAKTQSKLKDVQNRLAQIQAELRGYETSIKCARETELELTREIKRLETQVSHGVSGQKQYSKELNHLKHETNKEAATQSHASPVSTNKTLLSIPTSSEQIAKATSPSAAHTSSNDNQPREQSSSANSEPPQDVPARSFERREDHPDAKTISSIELGKERHSGTNNPEIEFEQAGVVDEQSIAVSAASTPEDDDEILAEDSDEAMQESDIDSDDSRMSIDEFSNESVSMSDSGSDDYEPAEPEQEPQQDAPDTLDGRTDSDEYEPELQVENISSNSGDEEVNDVDDYEPIHNMELEEISGETSALTDAIRPIDGQVTVEATDDQSLMQYQPLQKELLNGSTTEVPRTDDQESGVQLSETQTLTKSQLTKSDEVTDGSDVLGTVEPLSVRYVPYQSPLGALRSYRFHPFFTEQVKEGYRSLTYSHKIDPKLALCQTELAGSVCSDPECADQHFASMAITDDRILVQMSSASDIKDKTLRDQYLLGLKQVIARLRQEGVKEFSAVADALSQYRRDWTAAQPNS